MGASYSSTCSTCCKSDNLNDDVLENVTAKNTFRLTDEAYDKINKRQISLEEARSHNQDAVSKLKEFSLSTHVEGTTDTEERAKRLEDDLHTGNNLKLKVLASSTLQKNSTLTISPKGYDNSLRSASDGVTYFGCKRRARRSGHLKGPIINDFVIPVADKELSRKNQGRHFEIRYDPFSYNYTIKDLGTGFGCFAKLDRPLHLKDTMLLHLGESFILVNVLPRPKLQKFPRLRLTLYGGICTGEVYYFNASEYYEKKVKIGRTEHCEVRIDDNLMSKVQGCVFFNTQDGWLFIDGDIDHQRPSTNGTWLYLGEGKELSNDMIIKTSHTLFQVILND